MSSDPYVACIVRLGEPGNYFYQVIAGRENFPIRHVSSYNKISYLNWLQESLRSTDYRVQENLTGDVSLKSNRWNFEVDSFVNSQTLSLGTSTFPEINNFLLNSSTLTKIFLGLAVGIMVKEGSDAYGSSGVVAERAPHESYPLLRENGAAPEPSAPPATAEMLQGYSSPFYQTLETAGFNEGVRLPLDQARARAEFCMKGFSPNDEVATASPIEVTAVSPTQPGWLEKLKETWKQLHEHFTRNQEIVAVPVGLDFGDQKGDGYPAPLQVQAMVAPEEQKLGHDISGKQMTLFSKLKNELGSFLMSQDEQNYRVHASDADAKAKQYATVEAEIEKRRSSEGQDMQLVAYYKKAAEAQRRLVRCYSEAAKIEAHRKKADHRPNPWNPIIETQELAAMDRGNVIDESIRNPYETGRHVIGRHVMAAEAQELAARLRNEALSIEDNCFKEYLTLAAEMQENLAISSRAMVNAFAMQKWDLVYQHWLAEEQQKIARDWSFKALQQAKSHSSQGLVFADYWLNAAKEQAKATAHLINFFVADDQGNGDASELSKKKAEIQQRLADYSRALAEAFDDGDQGAVQFGSQLVKNQKVAVQYSENAFKAVSDRIKRNWLTMAA